jgi:hypothetical protein
LTNRLFRIAVVWLIVLATAWVAEPYLIAIWASADGPRTVTPRGNLTQVEQATIKLFQTVSPSVVGPVRNVVGIRSGIISDKLFIPYYAARSNC